MQPDSRWAGTLWKLNSRKQFRIRGLRRRIRKVCYVARLIALSSQPALVIHLWLGSIIHIWANIDRHRMRTLSLRTFYECSSILSICMPHNPPFSLEWRHAYANFRDINEWCLLTDGYLFLFLVSIVMV